MKRAFTLVEIMIVLLILSVLISLSIPNILRSRVTANEGVTMANLKALSTACQTYHMDQQTYPDSLQTLANVNPPYIDNVLGSGQKQGYEFIYARPNSDHFTVNANPLHTGLLKGRYFYIDESGEMRVNQNQPAGPDDPIVN